MQSTQEDVTTGTMTPTPNNNNDEKNKENTNNDNDNDNHELHNTIQQHTNQAERTLGILVLLTVPLSWGTYTPVVKYMYDVMDPSMPGFVFSAGYYLVAAFSLGVLSGRGGGGGGGVDDGRRDRGRERGEDGILEAMTGKEIVDEYENESNVVGRGGWELGSYLFLGNGLQVVGLQTVPADRAGETVLDSFELCEINSIDFCFYRVFVGQFF